MHDWPTGPWSAAGSPAALRGKACPAASPGLAGCQSVPGPPTCRLRRTPSRHGTKVAHKIMVSGQHAWLESAGVGISTAPRTHESCGTGSGVSCGTGVRSGRFSISMLNTYTCNAPWLRPLTRDTSPDGNSAEMMAPVSPFAVCVCVCPTIII